MSHHDDAEKLTMHEKQQVDDALNALGGCWSVNDYRGAQRVLSGFLREIQKDALTGAAPASAPPPMPLCDICRSLQGGFRPEKGTDIGNRCVNCAYQNHIAMLEKRIRELEEAASAPPVMGFETGADGKITPLMPADLTGVEASTPDGEAASAPPLKPIPAEWVDAANAARGLCESEANKWETASPKTAEHWRKVAVHLGALYLTQDHLGEAASAPPEAQQKIHHMKKGLC